MWESFGDDFRRTLKPYIERLTAFQNEQDAFGRDTPATCKEITDLEQRMDEPIKATCEETGDQAWISYAWRTKVSVMKIEFPRFEGAMGFHRDRGVGKL